jgi:3-oxoacyl-(acyl-carrier-protein) synthase
VPHISPPCSSGQLEVQDLQDAITLTLECMLARLVDKKNMRRYDDCLSYTLVSSKKALKQAGLDKEVRKTCISCV